MGMCCGVIVPNVQRLASAVDRDTIRGVTVANALTLLRGLLLAPTVIAVLGGHWVVAVALFLGALATDVLDGWVARKTHQVTMVGQLLDPVVDKAFYLGLFSALAVVERVSISSLIAFSVPQLGLAVGALVLWRRRGEFSAEWPGKAAAILTALAAGLLLLTPHGIWLFWGSVGAQFIAATYYLVRRSTTRVPAEKAPRTPPTLP